MLREIRQVRQHEGQAYRRCFSSTDMDLIIWETEHCTFSEFQFCYDKERDEKVITWNINTGFSFMHVDSGENRASESYKASPILLTANSKTVDFDALIESFKERGSKLPQPVREFVQMKLFEFQGQLS